MEREIEVDRVEGEGLCGGTGEEQAQSGVPEQGISRPALGRVGATELTTH